MSNQETNPLLIWAGRYYKIASVSVVLVTTIAGIISSSIQMKVNAVDIRHTVDQGRLDTERAVLRIEARLDKFSIDTDRRLQALEKEAEATQERLRSIDDRIFHIKDSDSRAKK